MCISKNSLSVVIWGMPITSKLSSPVAFALASSSSFDDFGTLPFNSTALGAALTNGFVFATVLTIFSLFVFSVREIIITHKLTIMNYRLSNSFLAKKT